VGITKMEDPRIQLLKMILVVTQRLVGLL
jgi:hypothetical protein